MRLFGVQGSVPAALAGLVLIALVIGALVWVQWQAVPRSNTAAARFDIILVLGTPSAKDGSPSPEQRERVLAGVRAWRQGVAPRIVMSGGAAHNAWVEAHSMALLAARPGVPAAAILEEPRALNTIQNVYYTVTIMQAHGWHSADVVSSASHLPRAGLILAHFPIAWKTTPAPWPAELGWSARLYRDWTEAHYCLLLRLFGFTPSPFLPRGKHLIG